MIQRDVLLFMISKGPGRSAPELAMALHNKIGHEPHVNQDCAALESERLVKRTGEGGLGDPYRYWPV